MLMLCAPKQSQPQEVEGTSWKPEGPDNFWKKWVSGGDLQGQIQKRLLLSRKMVRQLEAVMIAVDRGSDNCHSGWRCKWFFMGDTFNSLGHPRN